MTTIGTLCTVYESVAQNNNDWDSLSQKNLTANV